MRRITLAIFALSLTAIPALADTLPEGAVARVGSTRYRQDSGVDRVSFSADGKWLATESREFAAVWEVETGKQVFRTSKESHAPVGFAREEKTLRIVEADQVRDFDPRTGKHLRSQSLERRSASESGCVMSPDGRFAMYPVTESIAALVDLKTGKMVQTIHGGASQGVHCVFASNGKYLAIGLKNQVEVYDNGAGKIIFTIPNPDGQIVPCAISPDAKLMATRSSTFAGALTLWDVPHSRVIRRLTTEVFNASEAVFSADGRYLAEPDQGEGMIRLFDVSSGKVVRELCCGRSVMHLAFSPDAKILAAARSFRGVSLFDLANGKQLASGADPTGQILSIDFDDSGKNLMIDADDFSVRNWRTDQIVMRMSDFKTSGWQRAVLSPDAKFFAVSDIHKGTIRVSHRVTGRILQTVSGYAVLGFTPDSRVLVVLRPDLDLAFWSLADGKKTLIRASGLNDRDSFAFGMNGAWFWFVGRGHRELPSSDDSDNPERRRDSVRFWDLTQGREVRRIELPQQRYLQSAISPDGRFIALGKFPAEDNAGLCIWDVKEQAMRPTHVVPTNARGLKFSVDCAVLAVADENMIRLVEVLSGQERRQFRGHQQYVDHLAYSPDARHLASASSDAPIFVWDTWHSTGKLDAAKAAWEGLAHSDAKAAFQIMCRMVTQPDAGIGILRPNLKPAAKLDPKQVQKWIAELDHQQFAVRERASADLANVVNCYDFPFRQALDQTKSQEARRRLQRLLDRSDPPSGERLRQARSSEVLERIGTPDAVALLRDLAAGAENAALTLDARAALKRLDKR